MLEQPGSHDVGGDLGKDTALLLPLGGAVGLRVLVGSAVARPDTVVQPVACTRQQYTCDQSINLFAIKDQRPLTHHTNSTNITTERKQVIRVI